MRHAERDVLYAQGAAALDDLLPAPGSSIRRRRARIAWSREFDFAELLEAFGLDQL